MFLDFSQKERLIDPLEILFIAPRKLVAHTSDGTSIRSGTGTGRSDFRVVKNPVYERFVIVFKLHLV